jgi:hypothetical protein
MAFIMMLNKMFFDAFYAFSPSRPSRKSAKAWTTSSLVSITKGPYYTMGSLKG